jgi:hypothetical protein
VKVENNGMYDHPSNAIDGDDNVCTNNDRLQQPTSKNSIDNLESIETASSCETHG